ncbi:MULTISPECIES: alpha/beta fold hydrolase [unclassified Methylocystis]|jgi:pimeloyl-ACP methyl ester carboxylesterase|uniref:alpha/beta hydrolase n=1 Tax=unclassified Methylocystis TaxID=2625913 RepID=UPI001FF0789F|nr:MULTISPECIES: alpha/beta fold hydrolase [unclassified Methylocystis]
MMKKMRSIFFALVAFSAVTLSLHGLWESEAGLVIERLHIGDAPVTVMRKFDSPPAPAIVIAHGFSGSQQLMAPIATTLARNGYVAVTFDFSGHGRNPTPMPGGLAKLETSTAALLNDIDEVVRFARRQPWADGRLALVGHSMATDLVVRHAIRDPQIAAVAAFSFFGEGVTRESPKNLVIIDGAWESQRLIEAGVRVVSQTAGGTAQAGVTYGDIARGTGRRLAIARGVEHIGVLYSRDAMTETLNWMNAVFGRSEAGYIDARGPWLALLFAGLIALMRPLAQFLPQVSAVPLGAGLPWRRLAPIAIAPALLTPLILWKAPTNFLPILLGDYLVAHLAVYGVLIFAGLWLAQGGLPVLRPPCWKPLLVAAVALAAMYTLVLGLPLDAYVIAFLPTGARAPLVPIMFIGCALYFLADEWMTRGPGAARGGYVFSKFCFIASLAIAVALNPRRLFFLVIIAIVIVILLTVYGLVGRWVYARTRDPRAGALGAAFGLAWALAVTFPIID